MATVKDDIQSGAAKRVGAGIGAFIVAGGGVLALIVILVLFWPRITAVTSAVDTIQSNKAGIQEKADQEDFLELKQDFDTLKKTLGAVETSVTGLSAGREGELRDIVKALDTAEEVEATVNAFVNQFNDVRDQAGEAKQKADEISKLFADFEKETRLQLTNLEKDVSNIHTSQDQAKVERERNSKFTAEQPQRAATRIEQIRQLADFVSELRKNYSNLQVQVAEDQKREIRKYQVRADDLQKEVNRLQEQILKQRKDNDTYR